MGAKEEGKPLFLPSTYPVISCGCLLLANKISMGGWAIRQHDQLPLGYKPEPRKREARIWGSLAQAELVIRKEKNENNYKKTRMLVRWINLVFKKYFNLGSTLEKKNKININSKIPKAEVVLYQTYWHFCPATLTVPCAVPLRPTNTSPRKGGMMTWHLSQSDSLSW